MQADLSDDDDEDYRPPLEDESSESDAEPAAKKARLTTPPADDEKAKTDEQRQALWAEFQTSVAESSRGTVKEVEMVEIETRYKFAGKEITEKKKVPVDSNGAKQWLAGRNSVVADTATTESKAEPAAEAGAPAAHSNDGTGAGGPSRPRPGPRKPRVNLLSSKPKKLTMLEKSAMDWSAHLSETDKTTKEELEANRRSGGSLAKHDFLDRVGARRQEEVGKDLGKRRR